MLLWSISVYCRNEPAIEECIRHIEAALTSDAVEVCVIVNGVPETAARALAFLRTPSRPWLKLYHLPFGCKAAAMDAYIHQIASPAQVYFFVDGYAMVQPDALRLMAEPLLANPRLNAAAAVASMGRSKLHAQRLAREQGLFHGNLFALARGLVERIRARNIHLPAGLYRTDALYASMALHDLDATREWDKSLVAVCEGATWTFRQLSPFRWRDWKRYWNRRINQARGNLVVQATREIIKTKGYEHLPKYGDDMLLDWLKRNPQHPGLDIFAHLALRQLGEPRRPPEDALCARRIA